MAEKNKDEGLVGKKTIYMRKLGVGWKVTSKCKLKGKGVNGFNWHRISESSGGVL